MEIQKIQEILMDTFYEMSVDDGQKHDIVLEDSWMEERFVEAGLIEVSDDMSEELYPKKVHERMVLSRTKAINLDSVAASYSATLKSNNPLQGEFTRSTADSLFVPSCKENEKKHVYLIEFKNGDWKTDEVYNKIKESIFLLNDLEKLDSYAILTDNRTKEKCEVQNLELSKFYKEYTGYDENANFYRNNATFVLVSGRGENCFRNFAELCKRRTDYERMDNILRNISFDVLKKVSGEQNDFGFEYINRLAFLILHANSTNKYMMHFKNIMIFFDRLAYIKEHHTLIKGINDLLNKHPQMIQFLKELLYKDYNNYEKLTELFAGLGYSEADSFLCITAVCSVQPAKGKNLTDDFEIICRFGDIVAKMKKEEYQNRVTKLKDKVEAYCITIDKQVLEEICEKEFCDIDLLLVEKKYDIVVKRAVFILRMMKAHSMGFLGNSNVSIKNLFSNIYENSMIFESVDAEKLKQMLQTESELLVMIAATLSYIKEDVELRNNPLNPYVHVVRQLEYMKDINLRSGDKRFGQFALPLSDKLAQNGEEKIDFEAMLEKIKGKIIKGNHIQEIFPIYFAKRKTIDEEEHKLRNLATRVKGTILYDVQGRKAMDFEW